MNYCKTLQLVLNHFDMFMSQKATTPHVTRIKVAQRRWDHFTQTTFWPHSPCGGRKVTLALGKLMTCARTRTTHSDFYVCLFVILACLSNLRPLWWPSRRRRRSNLQILFLFTLPVAEGIRPWAQRRWRFVLSYRAWRRRVCNREPLAARAIVVPISGLVTAEVWKSDRLTWGDCLQSDRKFSKIWQFVYQGIIKKAGTSLHLKKT